MTLPFAGLNRQIDRRSAFLGFSTLIVMVYQFADGNKYACRSYDHNTRLAVPPK